MRGKALLAVTAHRLRIRVRYGYLRNDKRVFFERDISFDTDKKILFHIYANAVVKTVICGHQVTSLFVSR